MSERKTGIGHPEVLPGQTPSKEERIAAIKLETARGAFHHELTQQGCILSREYTDNIFNNDPSIGSMITVYSDSDIYGIREAVGKVKATHPDIFRASGKRLPAGTPPRQAPERVGPASYNESPQSGPLITGESILRSNRFAREERTRSASSKITIQTSVAKLIQRISTGRRGM